MQRADPSVEERVSQKAEYPELEDCKKEEGRYIQVKRMNRSGHDANGWRAGRAAAALGQRCASDAWHQLGWK